MYNLSQSQTVKTKFESIFGTSFGPFYDPFLSVLAKAILIDIIKFDDFLHKKHGDYEKDNLSMNDLLISKYGKEASEFINSLI